MLRARSSQFDPARKATHVTSPYQTPDASMMAAMVPNTEARSAPANGATTARTPGMKRPMASASNPYRAYQVVRDDSADSLCLRWKRFSVQSAPNRRPTAYITIAPATFPSNTVANAGIGDEPFRAAMNAPRAMRTSAGIGGNTFSAAASSAMAGSSVDGGSV